jgi:hypothetical protein
MDATAEIESAHIVLPKKAVRAHSRGFERRDNPPSFGERELLTQPCVVQRARENYRVDDELLFSTHGLEWSS